MRMSVRMVAVDVGMRPSSGNRQPRSRPRQHDAGPSPSSSSYYYYSTTCTVPAVSMYRSIRHHVAAVAFVAAAVSYS